MVVAEARHLSHDSSKKLFRANSGISEASGVLMLMLMACGLPFAFLLYRHIE